MVPTYAASGPNHKVGLVKKKTKKKNKGYRWKEIRREGMSWQFAIKT